MLAVLLFGPPGAGKGTQAAAVAAASGVPHIATGDMFREHLRSGSELGQLARSYMDSGELVPDDVTIGMLGERISQTDASRGFVLDGFPRTIEQASALDRLLEGRGARVSGVLDIEVPEDELVRRLSGRLVCRASSHPYHVTDAPPAVPGVCDIDGSELYHRDDDREDVIRNRVAVFEQETRPVREHYRALGTPVVTIDGARDRSDVESDLVGAVRGLADS
ncbi:MAG TPA: adenylate kinase [Gaiellales bacterium]|jgi:adenylate kinase|nr:adenylate kinase [Gaiellales bacterium]